MSAHTKTPWRAGRKGSVVADEPVPEMRGSDEVDYYGGHMVGESITEANAAFIVRACNAHDELVKALKAYMELSENDSFARRAAFKDAKAALEKAGAA